MLVQKGSREDAIHALINTWLKDKTTSCRYCNKDSDYESCTECNGKPLLLTNSESLEVFSQELQRLRETRANKYASDKGKNMRFCLSIPADLYSFLDNWFRQHYQERLLTDKYDIQWFMRKFGKYFGVPEET